MKHFITHFEVWAILTEDIIYRENYLAKSIISDLSEKFNFQVSVNLGGQEIMSIGHGEFKPYSIIFCDEYPLQLEADGHPFAEFIKTQSILEKNFGFWQEILFFCFMESGLSSNNNHKRCTLSISRANNMDFLIAGSPIDFEKNDLISYFSSQSLPFPAYLFTDSPVNTKALSKFFKCKNLTPKYSLPDIYRFVSKNTKEKREIAYAQNSREDNTFRIIFCVNNTRIIYKEEEYDFKTTNGFLFLKEVLLKINTETNPMEIYALAMKKPELLRPESTNFTATGSTSNMIDEKTKNDLFEKHRQLKLDIETAHANCDEDRASVLEKELDMIVKYLSLNTFNGKIKTQRSEAEEKCRKNVSNQIKRCIDTISEKSVELGNMLRNPKILKLGYTIKYNSPPGLAWIIQEKPNP